MVTPLIPGAVAHGDARDGELLDVVGDRGAGADGAEEGVPAVGDGRGVQEGEVECLERARGAAGPDAGDDGGVLLGSSGGWVGDVGEAHFEGL